MGAISFGVDVDMLLAAQSFVMNFNGRKDPRAAEAFVAVATAYCNGNDLFVPLMNHHVEGVADFRTMWLARTGLKPVAADELSDADFQSVVETGASAFAEFAERDAVNVAQWLAFEFSPAVSDIYQDNADVQATMRCADIANELIEKKQLARVESALLVLQREQRISAPRNYVHLGHDDDLPTFFHLCVAYTLGFVLRGYAYAAALSHRNDAPLYRHHWMRSVILQKMGTEADGFKADAKKETREEFPWGEILRRVFESDTPVAQRTLDSVGHVMDQIRDRAEQVKKDMGGGLLKNLFGKSEKNRDKVAEAEELILKVLREVGVLKRDPKKLALQKHLELVSLKEMAAQRDLFQSDAELVTAEFKQSWLKGRGSALKMKFRRDRFWSEIEKTQLVETKR